ncbi:hypothetical protein GCM10010156_40720 [Planobispora rosea]|uniref:Asp23/Gls24 family envelope stress response protein n=1 Tax=Planobispora rosea TaxID=35762 RepID=A0A8J3S204_PLARO|nr:Asp23/Gls24 family envelope stress response protein [Planobispora rosea]GGS77788.1 hypothetical protein GCM10010156_40720 [Planobispora rosea]GIH85598.1 hypothetical protein Pro02_40060 [Planobispora rosea]
MTDVSVEETLDKTGAETSEDTREEVRETGTETESPIVTATASRPFSLGVSVPPAAEPVSVGSMGPAGPAGPASSAAVVKGRIKVADEVVEKVAALATLEVAGVAALGEEIDRLAEPIREHAPGGGRGPRGVSAHVQDRTVAVDVTIVAEYGHVVMDVANEVKTNVARTVSRMLGMRVVEVNVGVEDVRLPGELRPGSPVGGEPRDRTAESF